MCLLLESQYKFSEPNDKPFLGLFEISPFSGQNRAIWRGRETSGNIFSHSNPNIFLYLGAYVKFQNPGCLLSYRKERALEEEEEREEEKNESGHLCLCWQPQAAQALRSEKK